MNKVVITFISIMVLSSCNSKQRQEFNYYPDNTETETAETDLSDYYGKIKDLSAKMQNEGNSFWKQIDFEVYYHDGLYHIGQVYPTAACALTEALNHGMAIDRYLSAVKHGEEVIANLQHIDGECYHVERYCADGIKELGTDDEYITSSFKTTWISVLERINSYCSEIREQVQIIRNAQ